MTDTVDRARRYLETLEARDWEGLATQLSPDVVYEIPQSRERIRGRDGLIAFNVTFPGDWHLEEKLVLGDDSRAVIWARSLWDGEEADAQIFLEFDDEGRIALVTDFWPEPYDPPQRAVPVERW